MKATEVINAVKELLTLSKESVLVEEIVVDELVDLSIEEVESEEVVLAEDAPTVDAPVAEPVEVSYVTPEELLAVKTELLSMIKALIEDKATPETNEVPQELSSQEIELSTEEVTEEVIHSPESVIESKKNLLSNLNKSMTVEQRVNRMLFN